MHGKAVAPTSMVLTDARIDERCQGGALLDEHGDLVGICNSEHVHREVQDPTLAELKAANFGFALSADAIRAFRAEFEHRKAKNATLLAPPTAPAAPKEGTEAAVAAIAPAVVGVRGGAAAAPDLGSEDPYGTQRRDGTGSGVVVSKTGLVLTNRHLLGDRGDAKVLFADGRVLPAKVVKAHAPSNLALLQVELPAGAVLAGARCGEGQGTPGEVVVAVGRPLGGKDLTVSAGVLSALRDRGRLQADPNLGNQNGGGALVDATGTLLGIVDAGKVDAVDLHFMMEGDRAKTETNLAFCPGLQAARKTLGDELDSAAPDETIRTAPAATAAELARRPRADAPAVQAPAPPVRPIYRSPRARPLHHDH